MPITLATLSDGDKRQLLSRSLSESLGGSSCYIRDVFADYFVYENYDDSAMYRVTYSITDDLKVTLGAPVAVNEVTTYEPVTAEFSLTDDADMSDDNDTVVRAGKIFETGTFPDKEFAADSNWLQRIVAGFKPVNVELQHFKDDHPLKGKLGRLETVSTDGKTLFGNVRLPKWLDRILPEKKVSVSLDRSEPKVNELSFVTKSRIADAALFSAYAEFSALEPAVDPAKTNKENQPMKFAEWLAGFKHVEDKPAEFSSDAPPPAAKPATPADSEETQRLRAQLESERSARIANEAANFADTTITACKALPAERNAIVKLYTVAATQDAQGSTVEFSGATTTAVDSLKEAYAARTPHALLQTLQPEQVKLLADKSGVEFSSRPGDPNAREEAVDESTVNALAVAVGLPAKKGN